MCHFRCFKTFYGLFCTILLYESADTVPSHLGAFTYAIPSIYNAFSLHPPAPLTVYWVVKSTGLNTDCSLQILLWHLQPVGLWEGYLTSLCPYLQSASINCTWCKRLFWGLNTSIHVKHWTAPRTSECTVMPAIINNSHLKAQIISFALTQLKSPSLIFPHHCISVLFLVQI